MVLKKKRGLQTLHAGFPRISRRRDTVQKVPANVHCMCAEKDPTLTVHHTWFLLPRQSLAERSPAGVTAAERACGSAPTAASAAVVCWGEAASEIPFVDTARGVKAVFWVSGCLLQRGNGGRGCHAEQWSHPTPYPTDGQVGNRRYVGREWVYPKRGGPGFYLLWIYAVPLMLVGLTGRLEQKPYDNKVKPVEPAQTLSSFENQAIYGSAEHRKHLHNTLWGCTGTWAKELINEQRRTAKKNRRFGFQQNLHISSQCKALSSVNG